MMIHTWRKATQSGAGNDCVMIRNDLTGLRDSKNPAAAITLPVGALIRWVRS